ncbi:NAD(P)-dependent oxidoreductase [Spiroplasma endosymbiont of Labia minor]|uniref:NAD(P)-dependent oxidoreductase n=1 Tax=Spiroplasma endosymbiont of Labia minor TaxID=3066305 RepID=UPI0030CBBCD7
MKILCYGIQESEKAIFLTENKKYNNELIFTNELLNHENIKNLPANTDAVILFVNCLADKKNLEYFKTKGVKYVVTRTVGLDHIDLKAATDLKYKIGRVPSYSPTAVASLAFSFGTELLRRTGWMTYQLKQLNFKIDENMFAKEFKNSTIGIIGTGRIGYETAKYWHGTGAKVLGYDPYENEQAKQILEYTSVDKILKEADLISLHIPYIKGENDNYVNDEFISKMNNFSSLVNVSRAALVDHDAIRRAIKSNKLYGYAADVFIDESKFINNKFSEMDAKKINANAVDLINLYPRVLLSPHVGYFTDEAVKNMAEISFLNLSELEKTGTCQTAAN